MIARDPDQLARARQEIADDHPQVAIHALACDVASADGRDALCDWIEDLGLGLSILVNNVGGNRTRAAIDYAEDEWRDLFETNIFYAFELCRHAYPHLCLPGSASIVNIGSVSVLAPLRCGVVYGMHTAACAHP